MSSAGMAAARPATRRTPRAATSPLRQIGQLAARIAAILLVAGLIVAGATAVGYSPLRSAIPGSFLPVGDQRQGPPPGVAPGAGSPDQGPDTSPQGRGPQGGRAGAPASGVNQAAANGATGQTGSGEGAFSGRNAPSLQRGWREEVAYLAMFAVLTAGVAVALRLRRLRRTRPIPQHLSPTT
jgi:hypothetical protein